VAPSTKKPDPIIAGGTTLSRCKTKGPNRSELRRREKALEQARAKADKQAPAPEPKATAPGKKQSNGHAIIGRVK
jgi:hypothetical protein